MTRATIAGWVLGLGVLVLMGCQSHQAKSPAGRTEPLPIQARMHGSDPAFKEPGVKVYNSHSELVAAGSKEAIKLNVDFATHSLLVLSLGEQHKGGYWARITGAQREGNEVFVQGLANAPAADAMATEMVNYPYDAVVIPKVHGNIVHPEIESVQGRPDTVPGSVGPMKHDTSATPSK